MLTTVLKILIQLQPTEFIQIMGERCGDVCLHMSQFICMIQSAEAVRPDMLI